MRKVLLSFLIGCIGFISGHASTIISQDWVPGPIIGGNNGDLNDGRNLIPIPPRILHDCIIVNDGLIVSYDPELSALKVYTPEIQGQAYAVVQNQTFGTCRNYLLTSGEDTIVPINIWAQAEQRLVVCVRSSNPVIILDVMFYIDDGVLVYWDAVER